MLNSPPSSHCHHSFYIGPKEKGAILEPCPVTGAGKYHVLLCLSPKLNLNITIYGRRIFRTLIFRKLWLLLLVVIFHNCSLKLIIFNTCLVLVTNSNWLETLAYLFIITFYFNTHLSMLLKWTSIVLMAWKNKLLH